MRKLNIYDENWEKIIARVLYKNGKYIEERINYTEDGKVIEIYEFDAYGNIIDKRKKYA